MSCLHSCSSSSFPFSPGALAPASGDVLRARSNAMTRLSYVLFAVLLVSILSILCRRACSRVWPPAAGRALAPPDCATSAPGLERLASVPRRPLRPLCPSATRRRRLRGHRNHRTQTKETANIASRPSNSYPSVDCHSSIGGVDKSRAHNCMALSEA
jgi:hypothetical protein